jgi:hypothetical protein
MHLFQLKDSENADWGLIFTDAHEEEVQMSFQ